jgi:hypothetical protein
VAPGVNRRSVLAGAAVLPAMSMPTLAGDDAALLAIREKMKLLWSPYHEAGAKAHEEYERAEEFFGRNRPDFAEIAPKWSLEEHEANWSSAVAKTDYKAAADRWNRLGVSGRPRFCGALFWSLRSFANAAPDPSHATMLPPTPQDAHKGRGSGSKRPRPE